MKILLALLLVGTAIALPKKVLVVGDSMSEEYRFEIPFSAPASDPTDSNTKNWVELLAEFRSDEITFGAYENNAFSYPDLRNAGYEFNWGVPGAETTLWSAVMRASIFEDQQYLSSQITLLSQVDDVDAIVIFLGGNDIQNNYRELSRNTPPANFPNNIIDQLDDLIDAIRDENSSVPIVIGDFPDVGGTEKRRLDFPDRAIRAIATNYIDQANLALRNYASSRGATVFKVSELTTDLAFENPYRIGNVEFFPTADPENRSRFLFCRDGFHPSTPAQVRLANMIVGALNTGAGWSLTPFSNEETLTDILDIPPGTDDAYLAWVAPFNLPNNSLLKDHDGDGLTQLAEFLLDHNPAFPDAPQINPDGSLIYQTNPSRATFGTVSPSVSRDLTNWSPLSIDEFQVLPDGRKKVTSTRPFLRLKFSLTH
ncbi:SGNH/GDSL hydrolase family protein [Akkermansiaceae bacterium]|nr:SGNH/GDSL hydrolase family protein [Akkermansiaceae bacterium]